MNKPDVQLFAEVRYQRRGIGGAGVGIEDARQAVRRVAVGPRSAMKSIRVRARFPRFPGGLLIPDIKGIGSMVDNDIAHDAPIADLDKVFRFLRVVRTLVQKDDALCPRGCGRGCRPRRPAARYDSDAESDASRGLPLFELFRVAAVVPHRPAYGFD